MHRSRLVVPACGPRASLVAVLGEQTGKQGLHRARSALTRTTSSLSIMTQNCRKKCFKPCTLALEINTDQSEVVACKSNPTWCLSPSAQGDSLNVNAGSGEVTKQKSRTEYCGHKQRFLYLH